MNEQHAVIEDMGGACLVLNETFDPVTDDEMVTFSTPAALATRYENRPKEFEQDGKIIKVSLSDWWLRQRLRRQYRHVAFMPGRSIPTIYNLWPGFSVTPDFENSESKCALYLGHIKENISRGDLGLYEYITKWMARGVQYPGEPGGAALVMRGKMGIGKGEFARHYGSQFGRCYLPISKPDQITGRFNGHMGECIVLFADECFFAGDPRHEQILKVLVTEKQWMIERKRIDPFRSNSCLHIILACNEEWAVPVDQDDRRFCCIDVGSAHMRDHPYFEAISEQMDNGGREALLGFLLKVDLTGFRPEAFPRTAEHERQRALTRKGTNALIEEICHEGRLPWSSRDYPDVAITSGAKDDRGFDHYIATQAPMDLRRLGPGKVKRKLHKDWDAQHWRETSGAKRAGIQFPPLQDLRRKFEDRFGPQEWQASEVTEWESPYALAPSRQEADNSEIPF